MAQAAYPYLDLSVLSEIRDQVIAPNAAVLFDNNLDQVLWANGEGSRLVGGSNIRDLLEGASKLNPAMIRQIAVAADKLNNSEQAAAMMRVPQGFKTRLIGFTVRKVTLPQREQAILLVTESLYGRGHNRQAMARVAVDCLDGYSNASAVLDEDGDIFAVSEHFHLLDVAPEELRSLAEEVATEQDRLVKRPIQTKSGKIPAGIARLSDNPASHILIITTAASSAQGDEYERASTSHDPGQSGHRARAKQSDEANTGPVVGAFSNKRSAIGAQANRWYYKPLPQVDEEDLNATGDTAEDATGNATGETAEDNNDTRGANPQTSSEPQSDHETATEKETSTTHDVDLAQDKSAPSARLLQEVAHTPAPDGAAPAESDDHFDRKQSNTGDNDAQTEVDPGASGRPVRFIWEMDADNNFISVSPELGRTVGKNSANIEGKSWESVRQSLHLDDTDEISELLIKQDTWSGKTVLWPVEGTDLRIPVDLAGLPSYDRNRRFAGFNGFGIIRTADALVSLDFGEEFEEIDNEIEPDNTPSPAGTDRTLSANERENFEEIGEKLSDTSTDDEPSGSRMGYLPSAFARSKIDRPAEGKNQDANKPSGSKTAVISGTVTAATGTNIGAGDNTDSKEKSGAEEKQPAAEKPKTIEENSKKSRIPDHNVDTSILSRLPIPVLVYREDDLLFANQEFFSLTGYRDLRELARAGGVDALFETPLDTPENSQAQIFHRTGVKLDVQAHLQQVPWDTDRAMLLTLRTDDGDHEPDDDGSGPDYGSAKDVSDVSTKAETLGTRSESDHSNAPKLASVTRLHQVTNRPKRRLKQANRAFDSLDSEDLRSILDTATDGIIILSDEGIVRAINQSAEALFDVESDEIVDRNFTHLLAPESHRMALDYLSGMSGAGVASILNDGREITGETRRGGLIPLFMTIGKMDKTDACCAVVRDITQWKKTEEELQAAKTDAEIANAQKTEFLTKISHEIRTPLNAIIGFSELMIEERFGKVDNERYRGYLRDINHSGNHVLDLINDLLDISKIEAGKIELEFDTCDLVAIVSETIAITQPQANKERVIIRTSLSAAVPKVVADSRSMKQIILNLVSNSIKYTKSGGQVIVSTVYEQSGEVVLRVRDTGVGMSELELARALKPFQQIEGSSKDAKQGTGLGLPLTKAMVIANRAKFHIESKLDEGTLVEIRFPAQRVLADR